MSEINKYTALYKVMHDDLEDAKMVAKYAHKLKECDEDIANMMHKYAKFRLEHYDDMLKIFNKHADKDAQFCKDSLMGSLWEKADEMMAQWAEEIQRCIEEY